MRKISSILIFSAIGLASCTKENTSEKQGVLTTQKVVATLTDGTKESGEFCLPKGTDVYITSTRNRPAPFVEGRHEHTIYNIMPKIVPIRVEHMDTGNICSVKK